MNHKTKMKEIRMEGNIMQDRVLQLERDYKAKMEETRMEGNTIQDHANTRLKAQQDDKAKMEEIRMKGGMMQDHASTGTKEQQDIPTPEQSVSSVPLQVEQEIRTPEQSVSSYVVIMQFIVHVDEELSHVPEAYHNKKPGMMTVLEPAKVDWQIMVKNLRYHGYKGEADLYYIKPGCVPPEGIVKMSD
uniref:Uncharacterized protein n=1 Tax=Triticum urartu TaxID=4572 RepID=A0A8R7P9K5_TRIUA